MLPRATTLHLAQPCPESWDAMTPAGAGRHCVACQKTVVDFTQKTDAEILAHLARAAGSTCGRLRAGQLERPLQLPAPASRWRAWLGALLTAGSLGQGLAQKAVAQTIPAAYNNGPAPTAAPMPASGTLPAPPPAAATPPTPSSPGPGGDAVVRGVVYEANTHEPLPGATVSLKGTSYGIVTDATGAFELKVAAGMAEPVQLCVSSVAFISQEITGPARDGQPLTINLQYDGVMLGGLVARRPYPWHPRTFYYWSRYQLTRLFKGE